jgi:Leucine-rich repeat (LRR) protein
MAQEVNIKINNVNGVESIMLDSGITKLHFYKDKTVSVEGLEKLPRLRKITFMMTAFINDYSFIADNTNIEILAFQNCDFENLSFVSKLTKLKALVLNDCRIKNFSFDLISNIQLEMLQLNNIRIGDESNRVKIMPELFNVPLSLKYIDVSFNNISIVSREFIEATKRVDIIFLTGNPVDKLNLEMNKYGNIDFNFNETKLPAIFHSTAIWQ